MRSEAPKNGKAGVDSSSAHEGSRQRLVGGMMQGDSESFGGLAGPDEK
jgi:hypothetical protein